MSGNWGDQEQEYRQRVREANRISIPALRDQARYDPEITPDPSDWVKLSHLFALVEAVEAAYRDTNHRSGCVACGNLHGHADSCPGARFDFGEET